MSNQSSDSTFCVERVIPFAFDREAKAIALAENPANAPNPEASTAERLALVKTKMWKPGRTVRFRFLNGDSEVQNKVQRYAAQWTKFANLHFEFGQDPRAEFRIAFESGASWCACGTDCLVEAYYPAHQPTMSLGTINANTAEAEFGRVVLHEFGHAIGCIHEHQNPIGGIQWNERAVLSYFRGPPNYWSDAQIHHEILDRYSQSQLNGSYFDPDSIMCGSFPPGLSNYKTQLNTQLSQTDMAFIAHAYPGKQ